MPSFLPLPGARPLAMRARRALCALACVGSSVALAAHDVPASAPDAASRAGLGEIWPARPASPSASGAGSTAASAPEMLDLRERLDRKLAEIRAAHARRRGAAAPTTAQPATTQHATAQHASAEHPATSHTTTSHTTTSARPPAASPAVTEGSTNSPQAIALVRAYRAGRLGVHVPVGAAAASATSAASAATAHWAYAGAEGPAAWGGLRRDYALCSSGQRQSPIDIRDGIRVELEPIQFDYHPSGFRVIDNGHTIQVNLDPGNFISVMGQRFELVQFHFHRPSEERIRGRQFAMEAHLVHRDRDGKLAVVAVLIDAGAANPVVQQVWNDLPLEKHEEQRGRALMDVAALLPADRSYYTYMGSLTTPPCSEGVLWMVLKQPAALSTDQIGIFARLYPMNARPVQSSSGRLIKESN